ncbi:molybdopterin molybdotransferase MoeA [Henriciella sp. AS95]|uniref:molybdopterin molybdotransferase MoeA n=1 Tax=Henriciella sp. AS95 TaxID=3135782 RepID=UPI003181860E
MNDLTSVDDALRLLTEHAPAPAIENVELAQAHGLRLATDAIAQVSRPPAAVSAMDGYAVRLEDVTTAGATLTVIGEAPAGTPYSAHVGAGEAVRIFTGGEVPEGADHIIIQEDARRDGDALICQDGYTSPQYIRAAGIDFEAGATLLTEGTRLGAAELSLIAAGNLATLSVYRRPRVGILANGDELRPPGSDLQPGEIVNSNPIGLSALIESWGGEAVDLGVAPDRLDAISDAINRAKDIDIFLPVGGASVGDHDLMRPAFAGAGFQSVFEKIAVRPGKPTWFSRRDDAVTLGLPGNPASAFVCAWLFLKPLLTGEPHRFTPARLSCDLRSNGPRTHFMRAAANIDASACVTVSPASSQDSSLISPFISGNALLMRKPNSPAQMAGELVDILLMRPIGL